MRTQKYKKPLMQRKFVWVLIICLLAITSCTVKSNIREKAEEKRRAENAVELLKGKVEIPDTQFDTKEAVEAKFQAAGLTPKFVVANFDEEAANVGHYLKSGECDDIDFSQAGIEEFDYDQVGDKSGYYAKKGTTIIVGYSDHDFDGRQTASSEESSEQPKSEESIASSEKETPASSEEKEAPTDDIMQITESPTSPQETKLALLAEQKFDELYPYDGSKMHDLLGVIEDWHGVEGDSWYYQVEATIANAYGQERSATLLIQILPKSSLEALVFINEI